MEKLRLAMQKKGRLNEKSLKLIKDCGIHTPSLSGALTAEASNFPLELFFLRDDDIPGYVADGVADLGIVGMNEVVETGAAVDVAEDLGFAKCRLSLAVRRDSGAESAKDLEGKYIATSYPVLLKTFLDRQGIKADIHEISGSVEIAPTIGLADAICDLVSTGSTLLSNGLVELERVFTSTAVLIARKDLTTSQKEILDKLLLRIRAVLRANDFKYIALNAPNNQVATIASILPGMKSPTVMPLAREGWSSMHSVISEDDFWDNIDKLHDAGAEGILVTSIEKMIF